VASRGASHYLSSGLTSLSLAASACESPEAGPKPDMMHVSLDPLQLLTTAASSMSSAASACTAAKPKPFVVAAPRPPANRMHDIISLLFSAMRGESNAQRLTLFQEALDAATQVSQSALTTVVAGSQGTFDTNPGIAAVSSWRCD
jgi:hypothetical protein